jgi:hypothetical protein
MSIHTAAQQRLIAYPRGQGPAVPRAEDTSAFRCVNLVPLLALLSTLAIGIASAGQVNAQQLEIRKYNGVKPTAFELATLPSYCWGFYTNSEGPKNRIPRSLCGSRTNHYCGGLIKKMRADKPSTPSGKRIRLYEKALRDFNYTLRGIEPYPSCPLYKPANINKMSVSTQLQILNASSSP